MKILFITDLYPIKKSEKHTPLTLHNFVVEWISQGHTVDVIKPNFLPSSILRKKPLYSTDFYNYEGVKVLNINYFTLYWFDFLNKLPKELDLGSYDIVIAHMPSGIIFANKLTKIIQKPLICGVHSSDIEVLTNPIYKIYFKDQLKDAYKNAKKIACRSFIIQKKFNIILPNTTNKSFVAVSGIDSNSEIKRPLNIHKLPIKILTCGNLIKRKNIDKLILAIKELEDFELKIIGDGKEFKRLIKLAKNFPKKNQIKFLGHLSHDKVLEEMKNSDIFILTSVNETFGMVYLEAMASGCITVCTKNDGIDGIIKDLENGFLCEPTPESIKETLLKIKTFKNIEKIIQNSFKTIKIYTPEICARTYLENLSSPPQLASIYSHLHN